MFHFLKRLFYTWIAIRDVKRGLVPQNENPIYIEAFSREYVRDFESKTTVIDLTEYFK